MPFARRISSSYSFSSFSASGPLVNLARKTFACNLLSDDGDSARLPPGCGVITDGIGVRTCWPGVPVCEDKRSESKRGRAADEAPVCGEGVEGALSPGPPGLRKLELRDEPPLPPRSLNIKPFSPAFGKSASPRRFPRIAPRPRSTRLPSRSSRMRRSSLACSNASSEPKRSTATSSTGLFSSWAVS
jgi:hypothetical protein